MENKEKETELEEVLEDETEGQDDRVDTEEEKEEVEAEAEVCEVEQLKAEVARLEDELLRNRAEVENFKKRLNDERLRDMKYRSQNLATAILPALDTFERAMNVKDPSDEVKNFLKGFEMIQTQLLEGLKSEGVKVIESLDQPFDPNVHQAVAKEAVDGLEADVVIEEMQKGYKLKDRVIRPAMVKVSE